MTDRHSNMDRHQERALLLDTERLRAELAIEDRAPCYVLSNMLSGVSSAEEARKVPAGQDQFGNPTWRKIGQEHDGYAPGWLMQALPPLVSPRRHWTDGIVFAGFGPETTLGDLLNELRGNQDEPIEPREGYDDPIG